MADAATIMHRFTHNPHGTTMVDVVYTNETHVVESTLEKYEQWLLWDTHRVIGLDLEYTKDEKRIAVIQLAMRKHVLVFHFCR